MENLGTRGTGLKVVHLISGGDSGGAKTHVLSLLQELNSTDPTPLLCLGDGPLAQGARAAGLPCTVIDQGFFAALTQGSHLIRESGTHLLHCHGSRANLTGALLKKRLGVKTVSTVHSDHTLDYMGRPLAGRTYGALNAWALRRMDALICVSDPMAALYRQRGFPRVYPIYNGVDFTAPLSQTPREVWLEARRISVSPGDILVGTAARLEPVKDLKTLLRGFAAGLERDGRLRLIVAGTGSQAEALRALAEELQIAQRVHFPGWVEDTEGFFAALDMAVLTSLSETFPYAVTTAARYGIPVVSTPVGGIPALVENGVTGFLFPVGDADTLGRTLARLAGDETLRRTMGGALRAKGLEHFSLSAMGARQQEIYEDLLTRQ